MRGVIGLAQSIANALANKQTGNAIRGRISGSVIVANGMTYPCAQAIDAPFNEGDYVWAVLDESGAFAVVVGK